MFRIVVAAQDMPTRLGLERLLSAESGLTVVGRSAGVLATLDLVRRAEPDVVLVDLLRDPAGGLDVIAAVRQVSRDVLVVAVLREAGPEAVHDALTAGASAFLEAEDLADGRLSAGRRFLLPSEALSRDVDEPVGRLAAPGADGRRARAGSAPRGRSLVGHWPARSPGDGCRRHLLRVPVRTATWRSHGCS